MDETQTLAHMKNEQRKMIQYIRYQMARANKEKDKHNSYHAFWDGKFQGAPVADGVYVWVLNYRAISGDGLQVERKMGHVTVLR